MGTETVTVKKKIIKNIKWGWKNTQNTKLYKYTYKISQESEIICSCILKPKL